MLALYHCTPADEVSFFSEPNMSITVILDIHVLGHLNMKLFWSPVVPYRCIRLCALILNTAWALKQIYRNFHYVTAKIAEAIFLHCSKWLTEPFKWFLSWMTQLKKLFPVTKDTLQSNRISCEYGCVQGCQSHSETVLAFARVSQWMLLATCFVWDIVDFHRLTMLFFGFRYNVTMVNTALEGPLEGRVTGVSFTHSSCTAIDHHLIRP